MGDGQYQCRCFVERVEDRGLVLFTGQGLARGFARWFNRSPWTHVDWCYRGSIAAEPAMGGALGRPRRGTIGSPSRGRMARSGGRIGVRCLNRTRPPPSVSASALRQESGRARPRRVACWSDRRGRRRLGRRSARNLGEPMDGELVAEASSVPAFWTTLPAAAKRRAPTGRGISMPVWPRAEKRLRPGPRTGPARCRSRGRLEGISPQPA